MKTNNDWLKVTLPFGGGETGYFPTVRIFRVKIVEKIDPYSKFVIKVFNCVSYIKTLTGWEWARSHYTIRESWDPIIEDPTEEELMEISKFYPLILKHI